MGGTLSEGSVIGGEFTVVRPLREGGMGAVYLAIQKSTGKERALKVMHREIIADVALQKRFEQEARVGSRIKSEHVVEVVAAGIDVVTGLPYLVMELLEGDDLRHHVDARGPLPHEEVRVIFEQISHAMTAAHAAGVVHRDLKPENVFLARSRRAGGAAFTVKVLDFGIAKLAMEAGTRATKGAVGSPLWMAPEQTSPGPVTPAADVWALGLVAYELFAGKSFWRAAHADGGTTAHLLREIVLDPIPRASERAAEQGRAAHLPAAFDAWFAGCVARDLETRFADAGVMWRSMRSVFAKTDELAATFSASASETGDATPFASEAMVKARSAPPFVVSEPPAKIGLPPETPIATVHGTPLPAERASSGRIAMIGGFVIAASGIAAGVVLSRRPPDVVVMPAPSATFVTAAPSASTSATASVAITPEPPASSAPPVRVAPSATMAAASSSAAPPKRTIAGGFADPSDRNGATTWKVQDRQIRLFSKLAANESNVADAVVKKAIEWSSWEYLRCYERVFGGAKDLPEGVVTVGFDILDQLPRHAALVSSTIASDAFNQCVVRTLVGQTINAAGPDGHGHAVESFRFVPMN